MTTRKTFIKQTGLIVATLAVSPSFAFSSIAKPAVGLQLYSLRDIIKNDIKGIIKKVATIGYKEVETYGYSVKNGFWGLTAKEFSILLKENGLTSPSGHFGMDNFMAGKNSDELKSYIEAANLLGSDYVTVPFIGAEIRKTADDYKRVALKLNEAAILCKAAGLKLAYHNHDFEFKAFNDTTGFDILLKETDKKLVDFELDLYWAVRSGIDPIALFKANPNRFKMWHVKDMDKVNQNLNAEIGQGAINFKDIFKGAKQADVKHYFIEHEHNYKPDELGSIKESFRYVNDLLL